MPGDVRFVAPIDEMMTNYGLAYMQDRARFFAADDFFPFVEYDGYNGSIFVDEARGTLTASDGRAGDEIGYQTVPFRGKAIPFMAEDWGFQSLITNKQRMASQVPGSSVELRRARALTAKVWLAREIRSNAIVSVITAGATLAGATQWSSTAPVPRTDVQAGKTAVLLRTGQEANRIVMTATVANDIITRTSTGSAGLQLTEAIKYVMAATGRQINEPLIAAYFDVQSIRFWKAMRGTAAATPTVESALSTAGSFVGTGDRVYIFFSDEPSPETSNYGISAGPLYYGSRQIRDPFERGTWVQAFQAMIELQAEPFSMYVIDDVV